MATLIKGMKGLYDFLRTKNQHDLVTADDIMAAGGWKPRTFKTYLGKNKLSRFLARAPGGLFRALRNGATIGEAEVQGALTQVTPELVPLYARDVLQGQYNTYTLAKELGRGAVGHVWEAKASNGDRYAAKVINPRPDLLEPTNFDNVVARFRLESRNGARLLHEAVVKVVDFGEHNGYPFLVMELADGSLGRVLKDTGPRAIGDAAKAIARVTAGLRYIHGQGCVHRDVKPDNMLQTARGIVVGDLGIVKWSDMNPAFTSAGTLTRDSVQLGSWHYMAPEQLQAPHDATPASDTYALGVSFYELLTGSVQSPSAFAAQQVPPPSKNGVINDLILRMTRFTQGDRPSLDDIAAVLVAQGLA
jgi:serine/threonine protein kinase